MNHNLPDVVRNQLRRREDEHRVRADVLLGSRGFRGELRAEADALRADIGALEAVPEIEGAHPWAAQIAELRQRLDAVAGLEQAAVEVIAAAHRVGTDGRRAWQWIDRLLRADAARRFHAVRAQGPWVSGAAHKILNANGRWCEAVRFVVDYINRDVALPGSWCAAAPPWRFFDPADNSLWLYFHHDTQKYKCMFFRVEVSFSGRAVLVNLEAYVPFGPTFGDTAEYEMEATQAYKRAGWFTTAVGTESVSTTDTVNLNVTRAENYGETLGDSVSETKGTSESLAKARGTSQALGENTSLSDATNWNNSWSYTQSQHNSSTSSSGHGGGTTLTNGHTFTETESQTDTETVGENFSRQVGTNASRTKGTSLSECRGISTAEGRSYQVTMWHYGLALGKSNEEHIKKWKQAHGKEGRIFDRVFTMFEVMCEQLEAHLKSQSRAPDPTPAELPGVVRGYIPLADAAVSRAITGAAAPLPARKWDDK